MGMFDTVRFRYRMPDGVTGRTFRPTTWTASVNFTRFPLEGRLLRWMGDGTRTDTCFDGMLTLSADDGYHLYFEHGTLAWIEVYSQGDRRWPFEPGRFMTDLA